MMRLKNFEPKKYVYSSLYFSPAIKKKERRRKEGKGRKEGGREGGRKEGGTSTRTKYPRS
jgi:hypothetical protein